MTGYRYTRRDEGGHWVDSRIAYVERNGPGWIAVSTTTGKWATGMTKGKAVKEATS